MPYVELQKLFDEANAWGLCCYDKGAYLADLSDPVIEVITGHVPRKTSPMSERLFYRLDGAYSRVGEEQTAFSGGRSPRYAAFIVGLTPDTDHWPPSAAGSATCGTHYGRMPSTTGTPTSTACRSTPAKGSAAAMAAPSTSGSRAIKTEYDPGNVFHINANIPPG